MSTKKCRFQNRWLQESEFRHWLRPSENEFQAYCAICCKNLPLHHLGLQVLRTHAKGKYHSERCPTSRPMDSYLRASQTVAVSSSLVIASSSPVPASQSLSADNNSFPTSSSLQTQSSANVISKSCKLIIQNDMLWYNYVINRLCSTCR